MSIKEYFQKKKELYNALLNFIDNDEAVDENFLDLKTKFLDQEISKSVTDLRDFLSLIVIISEHHHRSSSFISKIEKVLNYLRDDIINKLSKEQIFDIFSKCKLLLSILFKNNILAFDRLIYNLILETKDNQIYQFFYKEIKDFLDEVTFKAFFSRYEDLNPEAFKNFDEKREIGENDSYLCQLIRNDLIDDFVQYTQQQNILLNDEIQNSIYETNSFLIDKTPTLIEYAAFFGSLQIFQYLKLNNVEISPALPLYAIHGKNAELIHEIERMSFDVNESKTYLEEAIKCHHNNIANYIINNYINDQKSESDEIESNFFDNFITFVFHYKNYEFYPTDYENKNIYFYLCRYNYLELVKLLLDEGKLNLYDKIISFEFHQIPT